MKDTSMSVMIMGIPEPTSSVGSHHQWGPTRQMTTGSAHLPSHHSSSSGGKSNATSPSQWSEQDLDAFVMQLSNPQHHVSKLGPVTAGSSASASTSSSSTNSSSSRPIHSLNSAGRPRRAPLARSETDSSVHFASGISSTDDDNSRISIIGGNSSSSRSARPSSESGSSSTSSSSSIGSGLLSGLSGLRLIKNKKLARSSHANAKKYAAQKSLCHDYSYLPAGSEPGTNDGGDDLTSDFSSNNAGGDRSRISSTGSAKNSGGNSSPERSDDEKSSEGRKLSDPTDPSSNSNTTTATTTTTAPKEGKKRRFRRMLSRPLSRSQSAGCAKDVPAHAAFLKEQRKHSDEGKDESRTIRKERSSEGDISHMPVFDDEEEEEEDGIGAINNTTTSSRTTTTTNNNTTTTTSMMMMTTSRSSNSIGSGSSSKSRPSSSHAGGLRKMESMDASLLLGMGSCGDDFSAGPDSSGIKQKSHKNYNIAKKISRHMQFLRRRHTDSTIGVMDKDETRRLSDLDPAQVQEWSRSFESLLFDKTGLELFRGFLVSEHSDENIEFWIACEKYKLVKSHKQLAPLANKIFNDYVAVQSRREVNLDSTTRNATFESVTSNPNRQTFDDAQKRVQALMEKDSYRRFLESEIYVDLAAGNLQNNKQHS